MNDQLFRIDAVPIDFPDDVVRTSADRLLKLQTGAKDVERLGFDKYRKNLTDNPTSLYRNLGEMAILESLPTQNGPVTRPNEYLTKLLVYRAFGELAKYMTSNPTFRDHKIEFINEIRCYHFDKQQSTFKKFSELYDENTLSNFRRLVKLVGIQNIDDSKTFEYQFADWPHLGPLKNIEKFALFSLTMGIDLEVTFEPNLEAVLNKLGTTLGDWTINRSRFPVTITGLSEPRTYLLDNLIKYLNDSNIEKLIKTECK